jgi:hypothetical protein
MPVDEGSNPSYTRFLSLTLWVVGLYLSYERRYMMCSTNSKVDVSLLLCIFLTLSVVTGLGFLFGRDYMHYKIQQEAVKAGAAKWVTTTTEEGGWSTKFEWVVPVEKKDK